MIPLSSILLRLSVAVLLGMALGWERESTRHPAGMRTNALVALGSCLFTLLSAFGFTYLLSAARMQVDPTRVASYIVAGIGFLGGGAIIVQRDHVKGMTSAALIWVVAAIGMACGVGWLLEAAIATLLSLVVLLGLRVLERRIVSHQPPRRMLIQLEVTSMAEHFMSEVYTACERKGVNVERVEVYTVREGKTVQLACRAPDAATLTLAAGALQALPGVRAISIDLVGRNRELSSSEEMDAGT